MSWDDGKHTKVKKVKLTFDDVIKSIEVEYHGTNLKSQPRGPIGSKTDEFILSPDEYITEVTGYSKNTFSGEVITALTFKTNKNTFGPYGNKTRDYFSVTAPKDNQIAGFLGSSSNALNSIDVHFAPIPPAGSIGGDTTVNPGGSGSYPGNTNTNPGGTGANPGGTGGPGSNPGGAGGSGANPGGTGGPGANPGGPGAKPEGPGGPGTNPGGTNPGGPGAKPEGPGGPGANPGGTGGPGANPGANPGGSGAKPGSTETNTDSNPQKVEAQGVKGGTQWDDGSDHDSVTKIHIAPGGSGIEQIKFDYVKNGETKEGSAHGVKGRSLVSTFEISHPNEYLISAKFWFNSSTSKIIQGIQFKTNTKTSDYFGYEFSGDGTEVTLEVKDKKIVGFHGFTDTHLSSLGAYFVPITSTSLKPATGKKLNAVGGEEGVLWDDGVFDGVRKVYVGQYHDGVSFVKIEYNKGSEVIIGDGHGKKSMLGVEPFELDYPSEYITAIGVYYDNVHGDKGGTTIVTSLIFKTNKQTSQPFGLEGGEYVELKEEGHKIVGFHGKAGDYVHQIGVYVAPITN